MKQEALKEDKIFNRRYDDIVVILRREVNIKSGRSNLFIDYLNEYAEIFFGKNTYPDLKFQAILGKSTLEFIEENKKEDFLETIRKIAHFSVINNIGEEKIVQIKIFHLKNDTIKNTRIEFYYLIVRALEIEIALASFRAEFFRKINLSQNYDQLLDIPDMQSSINELRMILEFKKFRQEIKIGAAVIAFEEIITDQVLLSLIVQTFIKSTRAADVIGYLGKNQLLMIFCNCLDVDKPVNRIQNQILHSVYVTEKYKNQTHNLIKTRATLVTETDTVDLILKRLIP